MNRGTFVVTATVLIFSVHGLAQDTNTASQRSTEQACRTFVQDFYDWYVPIALQEHTVATWDIALQKKPAAFDPKLRRLLKRDSEAQAKAREIVGLDFDPILNSQDPSERFVVERVKKNGSTCRVTVFGFSSGVRREEVVPEVTFGDGRWRFANFYYSDGDKHWNLLDLLNQLEADRQSYKKRQQ